MSSEKSVTLEEPGNGIPLLELIYLRVILKPYILIFFDKNKSIQYFNEKTKEFIAELITIPPQFLTIKTLIDRPFFIEDSSRFWSVALLCRHLTKVNDGILGFIKAGVEATGNNLPPSKERLKAVKPEENCNSNGELEKLIQSIRNFSEKIDDVTIENLQSKKMPHPWLGNLTHLHWIWFAGYHFNIHIWQLKKISSALKILNKQSIR